MDLINMGPNFDWLQDKTRQDFISHFTVTFAKNINKSIISFNVDVKFTPPPSFLLPWNVIV